MKNDELDAATEEAMATFWITKYALTSGIQQVTANDPAGSGFPEMLIVERPTCFPQHYHGDGREWHRTRESAVTRAEVVRKAKIASLQKQIAKLEKLSFEKDRQP